MRTATHWMFGGKAREDRDGLDMSRGGTVNMLIEGCKGRIVSLEVQQRSKIDRTITESQGLTPRMLHSEEKLPFNRKKKP